MGDLQAPTFPPDERRRCFLGVTDAAFTQTSDKLFHRLAANAMVAWLYDIIQRQQLIRHQLLTCTGQVQVKPTKGFDWVVTDATGPSLQFAAAVQLISKNTDRGDKTYHFFFDNVDPHLCTKVHTGAYMSMLVAKGQLNYAEIFERAPEDYYHLRLFCTSAANGLQGQSIDPTTVGKWFQDVVAPLALRRDRDTAGSEGHVYDDLTTKVVHWLRHAGSGDFTDASGREATQARGKWNSAHAGKGGALSKAFMEDYIHKKVFVGDILPGLGFEKDKPRFVPRLHVEVTREWIDTHITNGDLQQALDKLRDPAWKKRRRDLVEGTSTLDHNWNKHKFVTEENMVLAKEMFLRVPLLLLPVLPSVLSVVTELFFCLVHVGVDTSLDRNDPFGAGQVSNLQTVPCVWVGRNSRVGSRTPGRAAGEASQVL
jgi:hypothetical protein